MAVMDFELSTGENVVKNRDGGSEVTLVKEQ